MRRVTWALLPLVLLLGGCQPGTPELFEQAPKVTPASATGVNLELLAPPRAKIDIAVYSFPDLTGKNEPNDNVAVFSRAVTQGGLGYLVDSLQRAGNGKWFTVIDRGNLNDLLQERQLIRQTRIEFDKDAAKPLPPIRFAGLLLQGGIIGFDSNIVTGGAGANFLGIGANGQYRQDVVTVALRVVSVQSGEVLNSVTTSKTIYSVALTANTYRFVAVDKLLQVEAGVTRNEPTQMAVRQAIDLAVYATIMEGTRKHVWGFANEAAGAKLIADYLDRDKVEPLSTLNLTPAIPVSTLQVPKS
ncbi:CsgG/HfaB family protein [Lichenihabitans psoromatis]|uniref:CsgG/HfaB family protein n=1 Tax=Lichenihabitans psoromatis TaxID=2528642 RepID=UPI001035557A|nr:CsgG/HfaB family protein [Lichenihabitans psoromatis]